MKEFIVTVFWDDEARVWCAYNDEIPVATSEMTLDALIARVKLAASDVLEVNGHGTEAQYRFIIEPAVPQELIAA